MIEYEKYEYGKEVKRRLFFSSILIGCNVKLSYRLVTLLGIYIREKYRHVPDPAHQLRSRRVQLRLHPCTTDTIKTVTPSTPAAIYPSRCINTENTEIQGLITEALKNITPITTTRAWFT